MKRILAALLLVPILALAQVTTNPSVTGIPGTRGQLLGTNTNDSAVAGNVGEYTTSNVAATGAAITSASQTNITSISLTAGDWDVSGYVGYNGAAGTTCGFAVASISTTSATLGGDSQRSKAVLNNAVLSNFDNLELATPVVRLSLASTTTVYLVAYVTFGVSTMNAYGMIRARRVR